MGERLEPAYGWSWHVGHIKPRASDILDSVSSVFGISVTDLKGPVRARKIAYPRFAAMYAIRTIISMSLPRIGLYLNRDHTSIMYGCHRAREIAEKDEDFRSKLALVMRDA